MTLVLNVELTVLIGLLLKQARIKIMHKNFATTVNLVVDSVLIFLIIYLYFDYNYCQL